MTTHHHVHRNKSIHHSAKHNALSERHKAFIASAVLPAQQSETTTGVPASVTIAQAILESAWGERHIGSANNYFGVKAQNSKSGSVTYGSIANGYIARETKEHLKKTGKDVTITAYFRSYASMSDSFRDHGMFIKNNKRYADCLTNYAQDHDADGFARGLQDAGYATDPNYAHLLISIMKGHSLYQYNAGQNVVQK